VSPRNIRSSIFFHKPPKSRVEDFSPVRPQADTSDEVDSCVSRIRSNENEIHNLQMHMKMKFTATEMPRMALEPASSALQ
jgi:hypothetical protein